MRNNSGRTESIWMSVPALPAQPKLSQDIHTEVLVVGGGIAGLSAAYLLSLEGRDVVVIDDGPLAGGETSRTTAHLTNVVDDRYYHIEQVHGEDGARLVAESHMAAIRRIEEIVRVEGIDCGFERLDAFLFAAPGDPQDELEREFEAARHAGVQVEWADGAPFSRFSTGVCLRFREQGEFHPLRYLTALASAIERRGGRVYRDTHVAKIESGPPPSACTEDDFEILADEIIIATNVPVHTRFKIHTKQAPYRTYVIEAPVPAGAVTRALYYDTLRPYHYARVAPSPDEVGGEVLIVGGEDHKTGQADDAADRWEALERWARDRFPEMGRVETCWSGQVAEPVDGLAFIGRDTPNLYLATGFSGTGMTYGTIAGMLLSDLISERENPWAKLYEPSRISLRAAGEFARENINVVGTFVAQHLTPGDVSSSDEIARGRGAVMREGTSKVAVYRDEAGRLHRHSAICPHLGCVVAWNTAESTWDCPCHGSRFDPYGRVLTGPSIRDLDPTGPEPSKREAPSEQPPAAPPA